MLRRLRMICPLLVLALASCSSQHKRFYSADDFADEDLDEDLDDEDEGRRERRRRVRDDDSDANERESSEVRIDYRRIGGAKVEQSDSGIPRHKVNQLRQVLCEGHQDKAAIFYHLIVSKHWHYYWLCS